MHAMESGRKRNSVKMQPRKVKIQINLKASWGPFSGNKFGGPGEVSPAPAGLGRCSSQYYMLTSVTHRKAIHPQCCSALVVSCCGQ